ncbi:MAG TPA: DUF6164 family protein [Gammaproteobacteria bacterium]|nr:DUF6164 family protein [Gammaproteobacteria bacterium]
MAVMLLNLRDVPDDEAEDIRALLEAHDIGFYETPPNHWGITMGAIWLREKSREPEARQLIADYQRDRQSAAAAEYERRRHEGTVETTLDRLRARPVQSLVYLGLVALILYFSVKPFISLGF